MSDATLVSAPRGRIARLRARLPKLPWVPLIIIGAILFATIFAPLLTPHEPDAIQMQMRFEPPAWSEEGSPEFPLGTDTLGRDLLTRILFGARVSLLVSVIVLSIAGTFGLALGIIAGYLKGKLGAFIMRLVDSMMAVPALLLALVFAMTLGPSMKTVVIALSVVNWARFARVIRGEVLVHADSAYVLQAKVAGASSLRIMLVHILPNVVNTFVILISLSVGNIILTEAALSFLGAGIPPPTPSWGQMVSEGRGYITTAWWISFFPGLALALTVLAANTFGDWLRDKLDPKLRQL